MKIIIPPLKCQGIKTKLVSWIIELAGTNYNKWIEPFMGSGVVGFNMRPTQAIYGDSNPHIIHFYQAIQSGKITAPAVRAYLIKEGEELRKADDEGYAHYRLVRDRFNENHDPYDFLFLSRAGFNGMMRFSKSGNWNIPFCQKPERFAQSYVTKISNQVACCAKLICPEWKFVHQDYTLTISVACENDLIYCAPPLSWPLYRLL